MCMRVHIIYDHKSLYLQQRNATQLVRLFLTKIKKKKKKGS